MGLRTAAAYAVFAMNLLALFGGGAFFLVAPESAIPGANDAARPSIRAFGALQLAYALLVASLGALHHGAYCCTMTFHLLAGGVVAAEAYGAMALADGSPHERFRNVALGHVFVGAAMLALLVSGGIRDKQHSEGAAAKGKAKARE